MSLTLHTGNTSTFFHSCFSNGILRSMYFVTRYFFTVSMQRLLIWCDSEAWQRTYAVFWGFYTVDPKALTVRKRVT